MILKRLFNKLFLVRTISSKEGAVHFRRWRLFACPIFRLYVHQIARSDQDAHPHNHPWNFASFILEGAYQEQSTSFPYNNTIVNNFYSFDLNTHTSTDFHKLTLLSNEVWSLVFAWGFYKPWGYHF